MRKEVITHSVVSAIHRGRRWWCGSTERRNFFLLVREKIARKEKLSLIVTAPWGKVGLGADGTC